MFNLSSIIEILFEHLAVFALILTVNSYLFSKYQKFNSLNQ